jgi:hypothetical protein
MKEADNIMGSTFPSKIILQRFSSPMLFSLPLKKRPGSGLLISQSKSSSARRDWPRRENCNCLFTIKAVILYTINPVKSPDIAKSAYILAEIRCLKEQYIKYAEDMAAASSKPFVPPEKYSNVRGFLKTLTGSKKIRLNFHTKPVISREFIIESFNCFLMVSNLPRRSLMTI